MKLHSRNRKRKLDQINGEAAYSISLQQQEGYSQLAKRVKRNVDSDNEEDVKILHSSQNGFHQESNIQYATLTQKIKHLCEKIKENEILAPSLLKKYISYAKHTVFPKLSFEACEVIKDFYISLRENASNNTNTLPITSR